MGEPKYRLEGIVHTRSEVMEDFEGPLDVIFLLLSKNKIDIQDVSITAILEQYLAYLDEISLKNYNNVLKNALDVVKKSLPHINILSQITGDDIQKISVSDPPGYSGRATNFLDTWIRITLKNKGSENDTSAVSEPSAYSSCDHATNFLLFCFKAYKKIKSENNVIIVNLLCITQSTKKIEQKLNEFLIESRKLLF